VPYKDPLAKKRNDAKYYAENRDQILSRVEKHKSENRDRVLAAKRADGQKHKAKRRVTVLARKSRDPNGAKLVVDLWYTAHPNARRTYEENRRARKIQAGGEFSQADVDEIFALQRGKCGVCRKKLRDKFHCDHIIPLVLGGINKRSNIQLLCPPCNLTKGRQHPIEFSRSLGLLL
jgi:5-methylcytosine-specific restriction endonuclease McrA